jgi:predicted flap endonuclease-1-like 5' DNA nuclease
MMRIEFFGFFHLTKEVRMSGTTIGMIIGGILAVVTILLIVFMKGEATPGAKPLAEATKGIAIPPQEAPVTAPVTPDNLALIEGIGPKIDSLLKASGILTFRQLAGAEIPALEKLLKDNGLSFAKPDSWPDQARLAADGKMEELKALQEKLVGGR